MRWRIVVLVIGLAAIGAVWQGFALWDSYANAQYEKHWEGNNYHGRGSVDGHWVWENGPVKAEYRGRGYTQVVYPLEQPFADFVRNAEQLHQVDDVRTGIFSGVRIYAAEDYSLWKWQAERMTREEAATGHALHVFAVSYRAIPFYWLPAMLIVVSY